MLPLKEDGSLDIEFINLLPFHDYLEALGSFTHQQLQDYMSKLPEDRPDEPMIAHKVDFDLDDPRSGADAHKYLAQKKKKYGIT